MQSYGKVASVACRFDGKLLLVGGDPAHLWDHSTSPPSYRSLAHPGGADVVAFHPSGKLVATGGADGTSRLWDSTTGEPFGTPIRHPGTVDSWPSAPTARPSPSASMPASHGSGTSRPSNRWDSRYVIPVRSASCGRSPDGKSFVTGCEDGMGPSLNAGTGELRVPPLAHQAWVFAVAFEAPSRATIPHRESCPHRTLWDAAARQARWRPPFLCIRLMSGLSGLHLDGKSIMTGGISGTARIARWSPRLTRRPKAGGPTDGGFHWVEARFKPQAHRAPRQRDLESGHARDLNQSGRPLSARTAQNFETTTLRTSRMRKTKEEDTL